MSDFVGGCFYTMINPALVSRYQRVFALLVYVSYNVQRQVNYFFSLQT